MSILWLEPPSDVRLYRKAVVTELGICADETCAIKLGDEFGETFDPFMVGQTAYKMCRYKGRTGKLRRCSLWSNDLYSEYTKEVKVFPKQIKINQ